MSERALVPVGWPGGAPGPFDVFVPHDALVRATPEQLARWRRALEALAAQGWVIEQEDDLLRYGHRIRGTPPAHLEAAG